MQNIITLSTNAKFVSTRKKMPTAATCLFRMVAMIAVVNHRRDYFLTSRTACCTLHLRRRNAGGGTWRITYHNNNNNQSGYRSLQFSLNDALAKTGFRHPPSISRIAVLCVYTHIMAQCMYTVAYFFFAPCAVV